MSDNGNGHKKGQKRIKPRKRSRAEHPVLREKAILTYLTHRAGGVTLAQAALVSHPELRSKLTRSGATSLAQREIKCVLENNLLRDKEIMLQAHGLDLNRLFAKFSDLMDAQKLDEIVRTELRRQKIKGPDGKTHVRTYPVTLRNTELVNDNTTQLQTAQTVAEFHGLRQKSEVAPIAQQNIAVIYIKGPQIRKKRQKQYIQKEKQ